MHNYLDCMHGLDVSFQYPPAWFRIKLNHLCYKCTYDLFRRWQITRTIQQ